MQRVMQSEMSHLEHFFEEFQRTPHEAIEGLNSQQCEPNRANSLLYRLRDFEITLGLISSRLASLGSSNQFLEDIDELTRALCTLQASYLFRYHDESVTDKYSSVANQRCRHTSLSTSYKPITISMYKS